MTLVDVARAVAEAFPDRGYRFLGDGSAVTEALSYADLDRDARRIAVALRERGATEGARVLVVAPFGLDFVRAFWGCLYAGAIAVPAPAPGSGTEARTTARRQAVTADAEPLLVLGRSGGDGDVAIDTAADATLWRPPRIARDDVALLQYTSGSTRAPRGVVVTHANLLHNLSLLRAFHGEQAHMKMLTWLPLTHDMGLVRGMLSPLHMGGDCFMLAPHLFVTRPVKWLAAIGRHRITTTGAPNFGYELCVRKISDDEQRALDLSSLGIAFCTAEPIRRTTVERFRERFAPVGFAPSAFRPAYGLAEATVAVTGELHAFEHDGDRVSCGRPLGDQEVLVVDDAGHPAREGEIWIRGPSVARGYFRDEAATAETFGARLADGRGPFLRTGDLGAFFPSGGLCVLGRRRDLVIVRGVNHLPHEIEATVEAADPAVRPGCVAAFGIDGDLGERVVVVAEVRAGEAPSVSAIRGAVSLEHEISLAAVVFVAEGTIPKTASGKIRRADTRKLYETSGLDVVMAWTDKVVNA